jgi:hypothetical protein
MFASLKKNKIIFETFLSEFSVKLIFLFYPLALFETLKASWQEMAQNIKKLYFINLKISINLLKSPYPSTRRIHIGVFKGDLAMFNPNRISQASNELPSSCTLLELDVVTKTKDQDMEIRNITGQDGMIYSRRYLTIKLEFLNALFMKIEQKQDYSG